MIEEHLEKKCRKMQEKCRKNAKKNAKNERKNSSHAVTTTIQVLTDSSTNI